jgi:hypothetical protein
LKRSNNGKNILIILFITIIFLSVTECADATADITATRTITPSSIRPGGSFEATVEVIIVGGDSLMETLKEKYADPENSGFQASPVISTPYMMTVTGRFIFISPPIP